MPKTQHHNKQAFNSGRGQQPPVKNVHNQANIIRLLARPNYRNTHHAKNISIESQSRPTQPERPKPVTVNFKNPQGDIFQLSLEYPKDLIPGSLTAKEWKPDPQRITASILEAGKALPLNTTTDPCPEPNYLDYNFPAKGGSFVGAAWRGCKSVGFDPDVNSYTCGNAASADYKAGLDAMHKGIFNACDHTKETQEMSPAEIVLLSLFGAAGIAFICFLAWAFYPRKNQPSDRTAPLLDNQTDLEAGKTSEPARPSGP